MGMCHIPSLMFPHAHSLHSLCVCCMFVFLCLWFIYSQLTILVVAQCSDPKIHPQCDIAWGPQLSCACTPTLQRAGLRLQKALQKKESKQQYSMQPLGSHSGGVGSLTPA